MAIYKGELQTDKKDLLYPHTSSDVVFGEDGVSVAEQLEKVKQDVKKIDTSWNGISGKPQTFPPSPHTHDDRYYTETEIDNKLNGVNERISDCSPKNQPIFTSTRDNVAGGEICFEAPKSPSATIKNKVRMDLYDNRIRFFEDGNGYRGAHINISNCGQIDSTEIATTSSTVANAHSVDGVHFHAGNPYPLVSNSTPFFYAFNGNDDYNCYVKNTSDITVGNANKLGGYTLDQIKQMCGGDYVGKTLITLGKQLTNRNQTFTYSNSKGGLLRVSFWRGDPNHTIVVDGATIVSDKHVYDFANVISDDDSGMNWFTYELMIPFNRTVQIKNHDVESTSITVTAYVNQ